MCAELQPERGGGGPSLVASFPCCGVACPSARRARGQHCNNINNNAAIGALVLLPLDHGRLCWGHMRFLRSAAQVPGNKAPKQYGASLPLGMSSTRLLASFEGVCLRACRAGTRALHTRQQATPPMCAITTAARTWTTDKPRRCSCRPVEFQTSTSGNAGPCIRHLVPPGLWPQSATHTP